jgi:hypothetical protein
MPAPIDYGVQIADPTQAFLGAFQTGASIQEARLKQEQQQQQLANQKLIQEGFAKLRQPGATAADYANLSMMLPETQAKSVRESFNLLSGERQNAALQQSGQVFSAFKSGKPEIAISLLDQQIAGKRNSGDEEGAKFLETWRDVAKENPKATEDYFGFTISQMPGGDKVITSAIALEGERRAKEKQPFEILKLSSEAIIKEQEAKFAPDKFLTDLNLTKEQIEQAKAARRASDAAAKKSGAEAARAEAEAKQMSAGIIPVDKRPELETKFRKEYNDQTKPYQEVKSAYGRVLSSEDSAVGDLSLIFGYMKMLDPGSVVREGEFATAQNAAGVPERITNIYNKVATGQRLSPSQRESFKGQAKGLYSSALEGEKTVRTGLERISKGYGLNTENIFYSATEQAPAGAPPAAAAATGNSVKVGGQTYTRPANFTDAQWNAYKQSVGAR